MNQGFFNPSVPFQPPPPNSEVNWAMLAQRWMSENTNEPPYPNVGNYYRNPGLPPQNQQQQYGNFFSSPQPNRPLPQVGFPPRLPPQGPPPLFNQPPSYGPPLQGLNQLPPVPLPAYGNPYASNSWNNNAGNGAPRPLFQSHAHQTTKSNVPTNHSPKDDELDLPTGVMAHWLHDVNVDDPAVMNWMHMGDWSAYDPNAVIDQQMRKKLPAWLLEGLEKAEKEKKQNEEKNKKLAEQELEEQRREKRRKEKGLGKFDSDSEEEDDASSSTKLESRPAFAPQSQIGRKRKSRDIDEQEFKDNKMIAIKRLVTSVLLESSDSALNELCRRVLNKARSKAKPQLISKSSGLAALNSIVGYSSDEDSDEE